MGFGPHQVSSEPPITRSQERKCHNLGMGPELTHVLALPVAPPPPPPPLGRGSNTAIWLIVRDVGRRVERDVRALGPTVSAFIAERTCHLTTLLTDDVPPRHLLRPIHSTGRRRRATLQTAHLFSPLSKQCARATRCTVLIPYTRSFPLRTKTT
jgi:hypothetical protein